MIQKLENSHDKIVSLASTGNQEACEQLIDMLYPVIEPIVRKHLSPGEEKQDVLQEVFMKTQLEKKSMKTPPLLLLEKF